ncbi:MAG: acyl-CoA thioesterase [Myxococcales bacterium]|nr:acyl-CoA thioesterase [Myxococcales bacterium]
MRFYEQVMGVYFDDLDAFQVLHNARYLLLFERTIGSFWRQLGWGSLLAPADNPDQYHVVRANHIVYDRPVRGVGEVRVRIWVEQLGRTSLTFGMRILPMDSDEPYCTGSRVIVRVDPETFKPTEWTQALRGRLKAITLEAPPHGGPVA